MAKGRLTNVEKALKESKPLTPYPTPEDISIDDLMSKGLKAIYGIMRSVNADIAQGSPSRNTVMNLKDVMSILQTLKKEERDILDSMSEEDLEKTAKK